MDTIPIGIFFVATTLLVVIAIEVGYRLGGSAHRSSEEEKESPVSAISGTILGLLAFMLAFTFAIVSDRYDARKGLVRDEANAIRTAYSRSEFLPEPDRAEATALLREYVDTRLAVAQAGAFDKMPALLIEADRVQRQLWDMAVVNARKDMNSDVAALYVEALNEVTNLHWLRVAVGLQARIPNTIWLVLLALVALGMLGVGYQTGIAGSRRTWAMLILALSFALVIALIAELDRPQSGYLRVTQQPLEDLRVWMAAAAGTR
jgi:hypothetical protein